MYIRKWGFDRKGDLKQKYQKDKRTKEERERERVNSVTICTILASLGKLVEGNMPFYSEKLIFSSLS